MHTRACTHKHMYIYIYINIYIYIYTQILICRQACMHANNWHNCSSMLCKWPTVLVGIKLWHRFVQPYNQNKFLIPKGVHIIGPHNKCTYIYRKQEVCIQICMNTFVSASAPIAVSLSLSAFSLSFFSPDTCRSRPVIFSVSCSLSLLAVA